MNLFTTYGQFIIFLNMALSGVLGGLLYHMLSLIKSLLPQSKIITIIFDLFYMLAYTVIFLFFLHRDGYCELRLYLFIGVIVGFLSEYFALRWLVAKIQKKVYNRNKSPKPKCQTNTLPSKTK